MDRDNIEYIEIQVIYVLTSESGKAGLFRIEGKEIWIPWSVIEDNKEDFTEKWKGRIYVAEWFLKKNHPELL